MRNYILFFLLSFNFFAVIAQTPTAGLMAYWKMDGNYTDYGPYSINGTNFGSTATSGVNGTSNTAMAFSNPSSTVVQYATHPANANLSFGASQDFSISFSIYLNSPYVHNGGIYDNNLNYGGYGMFFWNTSGYPQLVFIVRSSSVVTTNGAFGVGVWHKVCCIRSGSALQIYVDGTLNATSTVGTSTPVYNYPAEFGSMFYNAQTPPNYNGMNGKIDGMRIYNRALTPAEVLILLPVQLRNFTAVKENSDAFLLWQTDMELNTQRYEIERSTDGNNFTFTGMTPAAGNSNSPGSYQFRDRLPNDLFSSPQIFYRLKIIDLDGHFYYSPIAKILTDASASVFLYPNPVKDIVQLEITTEHAAPGQYMIHDNAGKIVMQETLKLNAGKNSISINLSGLPRGKYYAEIKADDIHKTTGFVLE